jgi:hypothetical protein
VGSQPEIQIPPHFLPLTPQFLAKGCRGKKYLVNKMREIKNVQIKKGNLLTGSGS